MENNSRKLEKINARVQAALANKRLISEFSLTDESVQAELRLTVKWSIEAPVDEIHYPKSLGDETEAWPKMRKLVKEIKILSLLSTHRQFHGEKINARLKAGPSLRAEAKTNFEIENGLAFLAAHKSAVKRLPAALKKISALQAEQKALLSELRAANSLYLSARKDAKASEQQRDTEALSSGHFWEASKEAIKGYFHPPFARNYLSDVSAQWRAALFTEMGDTAWKAGKGDWRHKNIGTGRGYLCGIDDNGDEWGHHVDLIPYLHRDEYGDPSYAATIEEAMASLFGVPVKLLSGCSRQGDLLFCPGKIPETTELHAQTEPWQVRESHSISSPGLFRNGRWFKSDTEIEVSHASHRALKLSPGEYRLHMLEAEDAD